jgi:cardiolipin synthase A/B
MDRRILSSAAAALVAVGAATTVGARPTDPPPPEALRAEEVAGRWSIEGQDGQGVPFTATIEVGPDGAGGLAYARQVTSRAGAPVQGGLERGVGRLRGQLLYTMESQARLDLSGALEGPGARTAARRAAYRASAEGPHRLLGRFEGSALVAGRESLSRVGADNQVDLLVDGPEAFPRIYQAIRSARRSICLQTFSWFDDAAGREMADLLIERQKAGVKVRCLVEAFPQKGGLGWKTGKYLKENGVEVIIHHKLSDGIVESFKNVGRKVGGFFKKLFGGQPPPPRETRGIFTHDHRKLIVVDGRVAFTGGMNIGDKYLTGKGWHDLHCRVEGSAVPPLEAMFFERWGAAKGKGEVTPPELRPASGPGSFHVEVLENLPGLRLDVTDRYLKEIDRAEREILVENAYMLYDPVVHGLKRQAQAGRRVLVIVPSNDLNDEAFARDAFLWIQNDVVRSGVELYKYKDRMAHGKVAVFDGKLSTIGTTNLDAMAMVRNAEINLFIPDKRFAATMTRRVFEADVPNSDRVKEEKLTWWKKVLGGTMHSIRSFL